MNRIGQLLGIVFLSLCISSCQKGFEEQGEITLKDARVSVSGNKISASTGNVTRVWELSQLGLITKSLTTTDGANKVKQTKINTDWYFPWMENETEAQLVSVKNEVDNDEGFANEFIRTQVEFYYPISKIGLIYDIWTMPGAPGYRTQLSLKKLDKNAVVGEFAKATVEMVNLDQSFSKINAIGYFNDTQHRNTAETPILKTEEFELKGVGSITWTNGVIASNGESGVILIKESHKCANQQGVNTGAISFADQNISVTGAGLDSLHLSTEYQKCWATWSITFEGDESNAKLALKQFDRKRYPIDPKRDIYIMSNTWGSADDYANSKYASREENILKELKTSEELGLDLLQIDDGWQGWGYDSWRPVASTVYKKRKKNTDSPIKDGTEYVNYPEGWKNVKTAAKNAGIRMGLWAASWIPEEDLVWNFEQGDFRSFKLDFTKLNTYAKLHEFENRVRQLVLKSGHKVRVNWDVTENPPRIGYYFGREYGNIYLENRKPMMPENVVYHPWLVLRDAWHVAKYTNLNKFQITYQNVERVNRKVSDAYKHNHDYALAITLMGSPIFFQEIHLLSKEAKTTIKPLIDTYKTVRNKMYAGYVFAIGEEPTNATITGFQNYAPETESGYLTLFREINCQKENLAFNLNFLKGKTVEFKNLMTDETWTQADFQKLNMSFEKAGDYKFIEYRVK